MRRLLFALLPLVLLGILLTVIVRSGPADSVRGENYPPVERLTFQRVTLEPGGIVNVTHPVPVGRGRGACGEGADVNGNGFRARDSRGG